MLLVHYIKSTWSWGLGNWDRFCANGIAHFNLLLASAIALVTPCCQVSFFFKGHENLMCRISKWLAFFASFRRFFSLSFCVSFSSFSPGFAPFFSFLVFLFFFLSYRAERSTIREPQIHNPLTKNWPNTTTSHLLHLLCGFLLFVLIRLTFLFLGLAAWFGATWRVCINCRVKSIYLLTDFCFLRIFTKAQELPILLHRVGVCLILDLCSKIKLKDVETIILSSCLGSSGWYLVSLSHKVSSDALWALIASATGLVNFKSISWESSHLLIPRRREAWRVRMFK